MIYSKNNRPIRVVMLLGSMPPIPVGGAEIQALRLCKQLNKIGVETHVITWGKIWHKRKGDYQGISFTRIRSLLNLLIDLPSILKPQRYITNKNTKIIYYDDKETTDKVTSKVWFGMILRYKIFYLSCIPYLWIRRNRFDIIHVHMMEWPAIVGVKLGKLLNKKVLIKDSTMNGISNLLRYPGGEEKQQEIIQYANCIAMTRIIRMNYLKAGIPEDKIATIPNGIEIKPFPVKKKGWEGKVIFVGNLTQQPAKGVDILLLAWKKLIALAPYATLHIIGEGDLESYKQFVDENGIGSTVFFIGKKSNIRELLLESDVFVLPSRREGMSNALMEAMLCAMPIVASDVSGNQDLIEQNISGILVPVADTDKLSDAILYMLRHPDIATDMGEKAYKRICEKCDIRLVASQYKELYIKLDKGS